MLSRRGFVAGLAALIAAAPKSAAASGTIQDDLDDAAADGGTVSLPAGVHDDAGLLVPEGVTLTGPGSLRLHDGHNGTLVTLQGDRSVLVDLRVDGNRENQSARHDLIVVEGKHCRVDGLDVHDVYHRAVVVEQSAESCRVAGCTFRDSGDDDNCNAITCKGSYSQIVSNTIRNLGNGWGIRVGRFNNDADELTVHVLVRGNTIADTDHAAMGAELDSRWVTFDSNSVHRCPQPIKCDDSNSVVVSGNLFVDCDQATAVNLRTCGEVVFTGNQIRDCGNGIAVGPNSVVADNFLQGIGSPVGAMYGIRVAGSGTITGNVIRASTCRPIVLEGRGSVVGNFVEACHNPQTSYQILAGDGSFGVTVSGNTVRNPTAGGAVTAFGLSCIRGQVSGNTLVASGQVDHGVRVLAGSNHYIVTDNVLVDATVKVRDDAGASSSIVAGNL